MEFELIEHGCWGPSPLENALWTEALLLLVGCFVLALLRGWPRA